LIRGAGIVRVARDTCSSASPNREAIASAPAPAMTFNKPRRSIGISGPLFQIAKSL
jgi:hypothetical protein